MKNKIYRQQMFFLIVFVFSGVHCFSPVAFVKNSLGQYRAHDAYEKKDFTTAAKEYAQLLADNEYDPLVNYNLGVSLYQQKKYQDAQNYFDRAVTRAPEQSLLQEQALFNRANSLVQQNKLQDALTDYKKVLQINPSNQNALKNLKIVEDMLKQPPEKNKQKNKDQKKQDQDKSKDKQQNGSGSNSDEGDQNSEDEKTSDQDSQQKKNQADQQQNKGNRNDKDQQRNQQNQQETKDQTKEEQEKGLQKSQEKETDASQQQTGQKTKDNQHESSLQKSDTKESSDSESIGKEGVSLDDAYAEKIMQGAKDDDRLDAHSIALLEKLDDYEKNIQKQLLQMNVTKQGAKQYGQKNW